MAVAMDEIKKLRKKTGAGVMDAKKALEASKGDMKKAAAWITKKGLKRAEKKAGREVRSGVIYAYVHHNQTSGSMIEVNCETDFVAKTDDFQNLAKELAMQVNSMQPKDVEELLNQEYIRDPKVKVREHIKQVAGKLGENIKVKEFVRLEVGK